jgi:predicted MPP superfamily phosphohydrolase
MAKLFERKFNRRAFIKYGLRLSILAFLGFTYERRNNLKIESIDLSFPKLPAGFEKYRIVQISDLHASYWVGERYLIGVVEEVNKLKKDLRIDLTITGHTHGGQVAIPYLRHHFIPVDNPSRYLAGLVKEPYGYTYVNRGIGTLVFPFRFCAPPEITYFTLSRS